MFEISLRQLVLALAVLFILTSLFIDSQIWQVMMDSIRAYR